MIKIPKTFFNDHAERDLPTPAIIRDSGNIYYISSEDPDLPELIDDAKHYADEHGPNDAPRGLKASAKALLRAIRTEVL